MRKSIVAILAVAIIGFLGIYSKSHSESAEGESPDTTEPVAAFDNSTTSVLPSSVSSSASSYKDGIFTGPTENTAYGSVQIAVVIGGGKITDVNFLQMPNDLGHTKEVTAVSKPILKQETLSTQNANIDFVSGATDTSFGYQKSLQKALDQAKQA